eukprot:gene3818-biopygen7847
MPDRASMSAAKQRAAPRWEPIASSPRRRAVDDVQVLVGVHPDHRVLAVPRREARVVDELVRAVPARRADQHAAARFVEQPRRAVRRDPRRDDAAASTRTPSEVDGDPGKPGKESGDIRQDTRHQRTR